MITVGVDEVGRGCWAGPLVAGAVVLKVPIAGLTDSKLLSATRRQALSKIIHTEALAVGLGWVTAKEVDDLGLTAAVRMAMKRAVAAILQNDIDGAIPLEIIIDGNYNFLADDQRARCIVKADLTVPAVSAASIIAKVARDCWMTDEANRLYPEYGFERHVGYGTQLHRQALVNHGITPLHRRSYKPVQAYC